MAITINDQNRNLAFGFVASDNKTYYYADKGAREAIKAGINLISVATLPTASATTMGSIYLVPSTRNGITQNTKAEYVTVKGGTDAAPTYTWEKIGDTELDLSGYSRIGHTHHVTSNVEVGNHSYTPAGTNAASSVSFAAHTTDKALGEATTFTNGTSSVSGSATVAGSNAASAVSFATTTEGATAQAITGIGASTVPNYALSGPRTEFLKATASGTSMNTVDRYVVEDGDKVGSVTAGSDASLSAGAKASFSTSVDTNGIVSFNFTANTLQTLTGGKATKVTLPTFTMQEIATGIGVEPTITLETSSIEEDGSVEVVTEQGELSSPGYDAVTFGTFSKKTVLTNAVTATAAAQKWTQSSGTISGTAAAQTITVGTNDKVSAITALGAATAAAQKFTGTAATITHNVTNNEVLSDTEEA